MSWLDMITLSVAAVAALECVINRLSAMHWKQHRPAYLLAPAPPTPPSPANQDASAEQ